MQKKLLLLLISISIFSSCKFGSNSIYGEDKILTKEKTKINTLNNQFINAYINGDEKVLKKMFSDKLMEEMTRPGVSFSLDDFMEFRKSYEDVADYEVIDQFLIKGTPNAVVSLVSSLTSTKDHQILFTPITRESYISQVKMKHGSNLDVLFTFIYGKYENQWKINVFHIGDYRIFNHTAPYYYDIAKKEFDAGSLINSYKNIEVCLSILKPGGNVFTFDTEKKAIDLQVEIMKKINSRYYFPIVIDEIETKPQIFSINLQEIEKTISPMFSYVSTINIDDTIRLKKENLQIREILPQYFKGIDLSNEFICYRALNKMPELDKEYPIFYCFVQDLASAE